MIIFIEVLLLASCLTTSAGVEIGHFSYVMYADKRWISTNAAIMKIHGLNPVVECDKGFTLNRLRSRMNSHPIYHQPKDFKDYYQPKVSKESMSLFFRL